MKALLAFLALSSTALCAPSEAFWRALHRVETGGRLGAIIGDNGAALGPLQIHRAYWRDAGVAGTYEQCADLAYSRRVVSAYLKRYAPAAWAAGDVVTLARVHNGGLRGHLKQSTYNYGQKVLRLTK